MRKRPSCRLSGGETPAGQGLSVGVAFENDLTVHHDQLYTGGIGLRMVIIGSIHEVLRIENHQISSHSCRQPTSVREPGRVGRQGGHLADTFLQREE